MSEETKYFHIELRVDLQVWATTLTSARFKARSIIADEQRGDVRIKNVNAIYKSDSESPDSVAIVSSKASCPMIQWP